MPPRDPDRLLIKDGFRHFRRTYSRTEVRIGLVILALLLAISGWIAWRGTLRPAELYGAVELHGTSGAAVQTVEGPVPTPLLAAPWSERERSSFDAENLYEKINGRAEFFTSKGFESLTFISLANRDEPELIVDLELYDMGSAAGALSAFTAERKEGAEVTETASGQHYSSRNAMFMVKGRYYGRALGADESETTRAALEQIRETLEASLAGGDRSWALELFVDVLGFDAGKITFVGERAFSLEVADRMWIAATTEDEEIFVSARSSSDEAAEAAAAIVSGFASYGTRGEDDPAFVTDEFLGAVSSAASRGIFVVGVRSAPDVTAAKAALERVAGAVEAMSPALRARAEESARAATSAGVRPGGEEESGQDDGAGETEAAPPDEPSATPLGEDEQ